MTATSQASFNAGTAGDLVPVGESARQAVDSLRGYAYQCLAAALAWLDIGEREKLYLEVAEDYAVVAEGGLKAIQVKDTSGSGSVTLNSASVRDTIAAFVDLTELNPGLQINLHYFTTSDIGVERALDDRPYDVAGLVYWRKAAAGAELDELRAILESDKFAERVRKFVKTRDDDCLRRDLLKRVHWDCGRPNFNALKKEFEDRFLVVARERFNIPASESQKIGDVILYQVLKTSILKSTTERMLRRADLYRLIDETTRISLPRSAVDLFTKVGSGLFASLGDPANILLSEKPDWLVEGDTIPEPVGMISRASVEETVTKALQRRGICVLLGSSGLGKSHASRQAAKLLSDRFSLVDLRDADGNETRRRLKMVLAHIGGLESQALILEDLNQIDNGIELVLSQIVEALFRRDRILLITCYRRPSVRTLAATAIPQECIVDCPYFSEAEVKVLISANGGDAERWGYLSYWAGAGGHPQLTHAFISGVAARGWPDEEISKIVVRGMSSDDVDAARDAARQTLISALPDASRSVLYRISIIGNRFTRKLALTVASLPPPIAQPGECIDQLVGPWIEAVGGNSYRVSPLASTCGKEVLAPSEQTAIHELIAVEMLCSGSIHVSDADTILLHALAGKSAQSLFRLALSVLKAGHQVIERLAEHLTVFQMLRTDQPIFPAEPSTSGLLRLAQFKLAVASREKKAASDAARSLFSEMKWISERQVRRAFEILALSEVVLTLGVANYLDDWVDLLHRFLTMVEADELLRDLKANVIAGLRREGGEVGDGRFFGSLFGIGCTGLDSVEKLEHIIGELDKLDPIERALWLTPADARASDYTVFINSPWLGQQRSESFSGIEAARCYERMAKITLTWDNRVLAIQCFVARAVMLDEFSREPQSALVVLEEAVATFGEDPLLARARAKIYWRANQHPKALEILRSIADVVGANNPIERSFALREAAISAAKCGDWSQAVAWFAEAQKAARCVESEDMRAMAIGLGADAAVAAIEGGDSAGALVRMCNVIAELSTIDPEASLRAAYCHRVVRHAVLWMQNKLEQGRVEISGQPIGMEPGACSNPDPLSSIKDQPLGAIDLVWYMLAQSEISAGASCGIRTSLSHRLSSGQIPFMEFGLRERSMQVDVDQLDGDRFSRDITPYIEGVVYLRDVASRLPKFDPMNPERGEIPALAGADTTDSSIEFTANDAVMAYAIRAALKGSAEAFPELELNLKGNSSANFFGKQIFDCWHGRASSIDELSKTIIEMIKNLAEKHYVDPRASWTIGLRFFERIDQSRFKDLLFAHLAQWMKAEWKRIIAKESFRLIRPLTTIPPIRSALAMSADDRSFIARLLLVTEESIGMPLSVVYREHLKVAALETARAP